MKSPAILSVFAALALASTVEAISITNPMSLTTQYIVGIHNGNLANSNLSTEAAAAQIILNLAQGGVSGNYAANTAFDYSGTIDALSGVKDNSGNSSIPAGWEYALGKYNGPNGGYVLFYLGGEASTIPQYPYNFWTSNTSQYALSHFTTFNRQTPVPNVPEGGATLALLGLGLAGLGLVRRSTTKA